MPGHIAVLGAGVIGLSSAVLLREAGHAVTIVARDFPSAFETADPGAQINYTSLWGGAHNRWVPPPADGADASSASASQTSAQAHREHAFALATFRRMDALARSNPEAGITFMPGIEYLESPGPEYRALDAARAAALGMEGFRLLGREEFPADGKVTWGCEYRTWCVNPMVYCCFLLRRFVNGGGRIVRREVRDPAEVFALAAVGEVDVVVNASGNGFGDERMFVTRGQTCLVSNPCAATVTRQNADGTWTFCVPRNFDGGTVIGGTKEPDNWDAEPSVAVREALLRKFAATWPQILGVGDSYNGEYSVIRDIVGRRPTRHGGLRLEVEEIGETVKEGEKKKAVVHAYGLGGRGFELSWGVALEVAKLVDAQVSRLRVPGS